MDLVSKQCRQNTFNARLRLESPSETHPIATLEIFSVANKNENSRYGKYKSTTDVIKSERLSP